MPILPNANNTDARGGTFNDVGRDQIIQYNYNPGTDPLALLHPVPEAMYNSMGAVSGCMEGTRQEVIEEIVKWIDEANDKSICWLQGPAGSGKSAISKTIAELCAKNNRLASSFFFLRGAGRRSKITHFVSSLAYNLAFSVPSSRQFIESALRNDHHITYRSIEHQFQTLITEPIRSATGLSLPMIVIVDALDECDDKSEITAFIDVVVRAFRNHRLPLRFFFTSRVEEHIRKTFSGSPVLSVTYSLALQAFNADSDIHLFFRAHFAMIYEQNRRYMQNVPIPWPSETDLQRLVERSAGSFIFASTLVNFVNGEKDLPHRKLQASLQSHTGLDPLYDQILRATSRSPNFSQIFETIMIVERPLSIADLGCLLQMEAGDVLHALIGVQSILNVPENDNLPVRPFHTSLRDFLTAKSRSNDLCIIPSTSHLRVATYCLNAMTGENGDKFFEQPGLQFATLNWGYHFHRAVQGADSGNLLSSEHGACMMKSLMDFVSQSLDSWINSVIFQGRIHLMLIDLNSVISELNGVPQCPPNMIQLIQQIKASAELDEKRFRDDNGLELLPLFGFFGDDDDLRRLDDFRFFYRLFGGVYSRYYSRVRDVVRVVRDFSDFSITFAQLVVCVVLTLHYFPAYLIDPANGE